MFALRAEKRDRTVDPQLSSAIDQIANEGAPRGAALARLHDNVVLPFVKAMEAVQKGETTPSIVSDDTVRGERRVLLKIGGVEFPIIAGEEAGKRKLVLFPPDGGLYSRPGSRGVELVRSFAGDALLRQGSAVSLRDGKYTTPLFELVDAALSIPKAEERRREWKATEKSAVSVALRPVLERLTSTKPVKLDGPPTEHADDLLGLASWNGRLIALTGERKAGAHARLWLGEREGSALMWSELSIPEPVPGIGATLASDADGVWIVGDRCLRCELASDETGDVNTTWKEDQPLPRALEQAAAAAVDGRLVVTGGLLAMFTQPNRISFRSALEGWDEIEAAPSSLVGATTAVHDACIVYGPGADCSGQLYSYDAAKKRWLILPPLPEQLGKGQVSFVDAAKWGLGSRFSGSTLIHSGGSHPDGSPSAAIYALDTSRRQPAWVKIGDALALSGLARFVEDDHGLISLLMRPGASLALAI